MAQLKVIANKLNRRKYPITQYSEKGIVTGKVSKGFQFVSIKEVRNELGIWYQDSEGNYYWGGGLALISADDPVIDFDSTPLAEGKASIPMPHAPPHNLPLNRSKCLLTANWLESHYGNQCTAAIEGTPFTKELLFAIACQETAIYFYDWTRNHTPEEVLSLCVFDASGDVNHTRRAFPKNTAAFVARYGQRTADMLIKEANKTRAMRGFRPKKWVYAGYGLFQYDIQHIQRDEAFFLQKQWYDMNHCLKKVVMELKNKWAAHPNDLFKTIKAYNGSGPAAENYANNVLQFLDWIRKPT